MKRFRRGCGCVATAASTVRFVAMMGVVIGSVGRPISTGNFSYVSTNRCSDFDLSGFTKAARNCGSPLTSPCFDYSRCRDGPTVYVYDQECSLDDSINLMQNPGIENFFRRHAKEAGVLADTYDSACFFINVDGFSEPQCATKAPLWNEGRNHVMFDLHDNSRDKRTSYFGSYAIQAAASQHSCYYRSGYDISIGLCAQTVFHELQPVRPDHRQYFLTFRGRLHVKYHGSEERQSVLNLHDDAEGVIVAESCHPHTGLHHPEVADSCAALLPRYNAYDYAQLMNSTFGLVPAGASPGTYRLGEVLSAGSIPVIVARDYVKPFPEEVNWSEFSFTFSPDEVPDMLRTLRAVPKEELLRMQEKAIFAYREIYGGRKGYYMIVRHVIDTLTKRIGHHE